MQVATRSAVMLDIVQEPGIEALASSSWASIAARPDLAPLAGAARIRLVAHLPGWFAVTDDGIRLHEDAAALSDGAPLYLRHALELDCLRGLWPREPVLAGFAAARVAALFDQGERPARPGPDAALTLLGGTALPDLAQLRAAWRSLAIHQPDVAGATVSAAVRDRLHALWGVLAPAERLLTDGGDNRLLVDPATGLNAYGCSPRPRPWAITFASTTATSISDRAYRAVETSRQRVMADALSRDLGAAWEAELARIKAGIIEHYGLTARRGLEIVLTPSGTDGELCALAIHRMIRRPAPTLNLLIAPEETGSGVQLAAGGRHFAELTARGVAVERAAPVAGLGDDVAVQTVAIRSATGQVRPIQEIDAEIEQLAARALAQGRRVLLHVLDLSKTGLLAPSFDCVARLKRGSMDQVDVLVDACQARLGRPTAARYLDAGFMLLVTGSKFFTGPPFAGALLVPAELADRATQGAAIPTGLADYCGRFEWPNHLAAASNLPRAVNHGLVLRWVAALAEMRAFEQAPPPVCREILESFASRIVVAIADNPDLVLHPVPAPARVAAEPDEWDGVPTIFSFSVRVPHGAPGELLDMMSLRRLYRCLNRDLSDLIDGPDQALAARCCHIGQPVALLSAGGGTALLRLAAGARIVSGVLGDRALGPDMAARLEREIADARLVLDKISLILRHPRLLMTDDLACRRDADPALNNAQSEWNKTY